MESPSKDRCGNCGVKLSDVSQPYKKFYCSHYCWDSMMDFLGVGRELNKKKKQNNRKPGRKKK